jgi:4-hydroxybenzoate polyprenyltransferase
MNKLKDLLQEMRVKQWSKNLLVFAALAFNVNLLNKQLVITSFLTFLTFCLAASAVYIVNDIFDRERDALHPEKKNRPIAAGRIGVATAAVCAVVLFVAAFGLAWEIELMVFVILIIYLASNFLYSAWFKHIAILDVFFVSLGFVLRILAGGKAIKVEVSPWIILCTILGSLFLSFAKRRHELSLQGENASSHRKSLAEYSPYFIDQMISVTTASTVMAYSLWTMWPGVVDKFGKHLPYTIPFVCYGIFRYLYLVHQKGEGGDPAKLFLKDIPLLLCVTLWLLTVVGLIYFKI